MKTLQKLNIAQFKNKNIVVLGAGLTGLSCARFLQKNNVDFVVNDSRDKPVDTAKFNEDFPNARLVLGSWNADVINQADVLLVSPGIDLSVDAIQSNISESCEVMGDVELYCRLSDTPILAVTGSNGKSTVVSLLAYLGKALGFKTELAGNIGVPILDLLNDELDYLVLELSSFQLETMISMNAIASSILNISDDHLDRHKTMANYTAIKQRIYSQSRVAIFNRDDKATHVNDVTESVSFGSDAPNEKSFGLTVHNNHTYLMFGNEKLIPVDELPLAGLHNALNYLAALALGQQAGWSLEAMVTSLSGFEGLPHRCQRVETSDNKQWINDSKATNVGATLAAISGLSSLLTQDQKLVLIAGGDGKGADFSPLSHVFKEHVSQLYVLGKDAMKIANVAEHSFCVDSIEEAVELADACTTEGDVILLSPACASIDMFTNFVERGNVFIRAVQTMQEST